ncbi:MAG: cell division protein SepF [Candidatus Diapherotrites archaeon]|nr:cell division protein SepF [Candidatus Diapherotrites archaeon]
MMGFLNKFKGKFSGESEEEVNIDEFLDTLGVENEDLLVEEANMWVRPYVIEDLEDIPAIDNDLDKGNIVILNVEPLYKRNTIKLKQAISKIKSHATEIDGDIARLSEYKLLVTPKGVKVAKVKK